MGSAVFIKYFHEVRADHLSIAAFDVMTFYEMYQFAILKQGNGR